MNKNILDYFEDTVRVNSSKNAIIKGKESITFEELRDKSKMLGYHVSQMVSGATNEPVAVLLDKSIEAVICDLGITYSGNIFTNLDIKTPSERLNNVIDVVKPKLLITLEKYSKLVEFDSESILYIDKWLDTFCEYSKNVLATEYDSFINTLDFICNRQIDTDPFCIINTSGSTGTPKGVVLNHKSFVDFMNWSINEFKFDGSEIIGGLSPIVFDIYDFEICLMMFKGATIVMLDSILAAFPAKLLMELNDKKVNFLFWVPTIMVNIANMNLFEKIKPQYLKAVWFAGEVFPTKQFNYWRRNLSDVVFANLYGPIEITLDCIFYVADKELSDDEPLPIGVACRNTDILLLDEDNNLCKDGEEGEICVRGTSLAMGYYNNPEKTKLAFVQNPLNTSYPELIYRTGDIAIKDSNQLYMFRGRRDSLIKHQGYRIELTEIEHIVVNKLALVKNGCVVYDKKDKEIVLIYEPNENDEITIRKELGKELPRYMIPTRYEIKDELPRNTNGKIDRLLLSQIINN